MSSILNHLEYNCFSLFEEPDLKNTKKGNMSGFHLYTSNRQEELIDYMAHQVLKKPLPDPLSTELIVVQHQGIQKWVSLELTSKLGILANTRFLFPNELAQMAFKGVVKGYENTWDPEQLHWYLFDQLLSVPEDPDFELIKEFQSTQKELKAFQLAKQLSNLFDQYDMFRPGLMESWELGKDTNWQSKLFSNLPAATKAGRKSEVLLQFQGQIKKVKFKDIGLPERITFFGISYLPPLHLEVIKGLSLILDIHFFFLNPSPHYWADLVPQKKIIKAALNRSTKPDEDHHYDEGNALLASWGRYGQEFFNSLYDQNLVEEADIFIENSADTEALSKGNLLHRIQQDIFDLNNPKRDSEVVEFQISEKDNSIQIHSCHSPMREIEVLKDSLLMMFTKNELKPEDVLVMTPDIDHYAPLIQSVFSTGNEDKNKIPYSITDRVFIKESVVIQYFLKVFDVAQSRYSITDIFTLLTSKSIKEKFQLSDADLTLIKGWLQSVNVCWGIDENFKRLKGVQPTYENTWRYGIDRILSGFAVPGQENTLLQESTDKNFILPFDHIEGTNAVIFGKFLDFYDFLVSLAPGGGNSIFRKRTLDEWVELSETIVEALFKEHKDWKDEFLTLTDGIRQLATTGKETGFSGVIGVDALIDYFQTQFGEILNHRGYIAGGVTFAAMKPMRSVPFQVIALIGMNDKAFPRSDNSISFDLSDKARKGDRSVNGEDRYLFLETLICTRKILYLSYLGKSIKDNSLLAPSTLVSELLDYIEEGYLSKDEIDQQLVVNHPLQAFSSRNFAGDRSLYSFSKPNLDAAKALVAPNKNLRSDLQLNLPVPDEDFNRITIEKLVRFFDNPAKFLLHSRLKIYLDESQMEPEENEPFDLGNISKYITEGDIFNALGHKSKEQTKQIIKSKGMLPHHFVGERQYNRLYDSIDEFKQEIDFYTGEPKLEPYAFEIQLGDLLLSGTIRSARRGFLLNHRHSRVKVKDRIRGWLEHLVINYLKPDGYPRTSILIGKNGKEDKVEIFQMDPIEDPKKPLIDLIAIYHSGLSRTPAFFPRSADSYMEAYLKAIEKVDEPVACQKARKSAMSTWDGFQEVQGEAEDRYFKLFFENQSLFEDTQFEANIQNILFPIYNHQIEMGEN
ncbi:MAG: exodeoxyribonuclease V subunit gamma [Proteobacteria bacterium]|nr:exodeoxyribonuclease V subunit gamma [Pseudomonadota bacterium]